MSAWFSLTIILSCVRGFEIHFNLQSTGPLLIAVSLLKKVFPDLIYCPFCCYFSDLGCVFLGAILNENSWNVFFAHSKLGKAVSFHSAFRIVILFYQIPIILTILILSILILEEPPKHVPKNRKSMFLKCVFIYLGVP